MNMNRSTGMVVLLIMFIAPSFFIVPETSYACSCANVTLDQVMEMKKAVFSGRLEKIETGKIASPYGRGERRQHYAYTFLVDRVWKGDVPSKVIVYSDIHEASCGIELTADNNYLVFAGGEERLFTGYCDRTKLMSQASEDLNRLGEGSLPSAGHPQQSAVFPGILESHLPYAVILVIVGVVLSVVLSWFVIKRYRQ